MQNNFELQSSILPLYQQILPHFVSVSGQVPLNQNQKIQP